MAPLKSSLILALVATVLASSSICSCSVHVTSTIKNGAPTSTHTTSSSSSSSTNTKTIASSSTTSTQSALTTTTTTTTTAATTSGVCTFSGSSGAASASASKASCSTIVMSSVAVPSGVTLDLTGLNQGTTVIFEGTTTFGYEQWTGPLVSVSGTNINVTGASGSVLNGNGNAWWDGDGSNGGKTKPTFFYAHNLLGSSFINNVYIENSPVQVFSVYGSTGLTLSGVTVNNTGTNSSLAANTDCFDIGDSTNILIEDAVCYNQDDCMAINSGTDITFTGGLCSGGHGLSIGSVGGRTYNTVTGVLVENSTIKSSQNGVRIKTVYNATGSVSNVTYSNISLSGITNYGIVIEQDYENGSPTGTPTDGVPITNVTLNGISGTVDSTGTDIYILCGNCSNWVWENIDVTGGKVSTKCQGVPSGASCSD